MPVPVFVCFQTAGEKPIIVNGEMQMLMMVPLPKAQKLGVV